VQVAPPPVKPIIIIIIIITHMENSHNMTIICILPQLEFEFKGMGNA
jgi:hypothetical protein